MNLKVNSPLNVEETKQKIIDYFNNHSEEQFKLSLEEVLNSSCVFCGVKVRDCKCSVDLENGTTEIGDDK